MYRLKLRPDSSHMFMEHRHGMLLKAEQLVHDSRFWAVVALIAVLAVLIGLAIWAGMAGDGGTELRPVSPFYYGYPY